MPEVRDMPIQTWATTPAMMALLAWTGAVKLQHGEEYGPSMTVHYFVFYFA
jgi:hypothetical protein